ncbi:ABC transporter permease [Natronoglycomyces albus]|uniref:Transport permease protein n=1 Tax=Natronoglycomyces albus TaxID=2811108 RepID=A0A895XTN2_9ACTN|nr:ABC transporter permease [Natronoglycomyces albus]QSB04998.1 ABC transporter permease [Natronoglycomyces albus]
MKFFRDTYLVFERRILLQIKQPIWLFVMLIQPLYYLVLFGPLLNGMQDMPGFERGVMETFLPGLLIMMALFGSISVGFALIAELREGVIERMRVTPVSRFALLLGRCGSIVVGMIFQVALLILLSVPLAGTTIYWEGLFMLMGLVVLITIMLSAISYGLALMTKSEDALAPLLNTVTQPVILLSGIMLPMALAPGWLQTLAAFNPFAYAVNAARALFVGSYDDPVVWQAGVILGAFTLLMVVWSGRRFARAVA